MKLRNNEGYMQVNLFKDKKCKTFQVHRLVATAFIPTLNKRLQINHKDSNKSNNNVDNLEWCTPSQNQIHAYQKGLRKDNFKKIEQYTLDGKFIKLWVGIQNAGRKTGIEYTNIIACLKGRTKTAGGYIWKYAK